MAGKAKTLTNQQFARVLHYVATTGRNPFRDCVALLLSFRAGLRVAEIAGLTWNDVTDAFGEVGTALTIPRRIAKKGSGRTIPMHSELRGALRILKEAMGAEFTRPNEPVIRALKPRNGSFYTTPGSLQHYISRTYASLGLSGCSSHSGRRTFITQMSRITSLHDCSLHDVQRLAGHKYIDTTEGYIEPSDGITAMVESL